MKYGSLGILTFFGLLAFFVSGPALAQQSYFAGWSSYVGEDYDSDSVRAVAVDSQTNLYVVGALGGGGVSLSNLDGVLATENQWYYTTGGEDGFIAKVDRLGHVLWYAPICGTDNDRLNAVAVHTNGTVYAAGFVGRTDDYSDEGTDAILVALSGASGADAWTCSLGYFGCTNGFNAVAVDSNGYIYAAGYTSWTDLPNAVSGSAYKGRGDAFVVKVSPAGSVVWSCYLGGTNADTAAALALAADGSVYVGGQTRSPGWTSVPTSTTAPSTPDGFVAKLTASGTTVWSACIGGSASNAVTALARSPASSALFLGGATTASGLFSGATRLNSYAGAGDGFVAALSDLGGSFQTNWCRFFGGSGADRVQSLCFLTNGFLAVGGDTASGSWLTQNGDSAFRGVRDGFVSLLGNDGSVAWSSYVGGTNRDEVSSVVCAADKLIAAGSTVSPFPLGWINGGFWNDWTKDPSYNIPPIPDYGANFSYGLLVTWTAEPGLPPTITDQPDDLTVGEGTPAVFSVAASGTAPLYYRWYRNGAPVTGLTSNTYVIASAATTNNNDVYACVVSNFYGVAVSSNATLTVIAKGALSVTLSPAQAVAQGAKWSLNGGATWLASGASTNLPPGAYAVAFSNLTGWVAPAALADVQVVAGASTATSAVYTAVLPSASRVISGTNVTVTVQAPAGLSSWVLVETLPAGITPTNVTAGGVWSNSVRTLTFSGVEATTNTCSYTALCATSGLYTVSGTVTPQPANVPVAVTGDAQILKASVIRKISGTAVTIIMYQPTVNKSWYINEYLPTELTPTNVSGTGTWIPEEGMIYWGTYGKGQTNTYEVTGAPGTYELPGSVVSIAGVVEPIFGDSVVTIPGGEPGEPVPPPDILFFAPASASTCTLTFTSVVNQAYAILTNATLSATNAWSVYLSPVAGEAGVTQREVPMAGPQLFYRVRVSQ